MSIRKLGLLLLCGAFYFAPSAILEATQYQGLEPRRVTVEDLVRTSAMYNETPVIVQGELRFGDPDDATADIFELAGEESMRTVRVGAASHSMNDLRFMTGNRVEVSGIFFDTSMLAVPPRMHPVLRYYPGAVRQDSLSFDQNYFIAVTGVDVIEDLKSDLVPDIEDEPEIEDPEINVDGVLEVDLRDLVASPERFVERRLVVTGKFRGNNLYGDLSIRDKRTPRDFVIKVADAAIWVTGRRPRGPGFRLDSKRRRDTGNWLRVYGTPWEHEETFYLRAEKIELAEDPVDPDLEPVRVVAEDEEEPGPPPEVVFSLPLESEAAIPLDTEFQVQFSKDMKSGSFNRNVDLLYSDDDGVSNPFPDLEVHYDDASRTLTVRPGKRLEPSKEIYLILYDAIEDDESQTLRVQPQAAEIEPGAAVVLVFRTATS